jgi:hypothetical protein
MSGKKLFFKLLIKIAVIFFFLVREIVTGWQSALSFGTPVKIGPGKNCLRSEVQGMTSRNFYGRNLYQKLTGNVI